MTLRQVLRADARQQTVSTCIFPVHLMQRYSRQGYLTSVLDRCLVVDGVNPVDRPPRPAARLLKDKLSDADRRVIVQARTVNGVSMLALARRFGVSDHSIRKVLLEAGVWAGRSSIAPETIRHIHNLWLADCSVASIARQTGLPESTVRLQLSRNRR